VLLHIKRKRGEAFDSCRRAAGELPAPHRTFYDVQRLLTWPFPDYARYACEYHHPTGVISRPLVTTIPNGQLRAGCLLVCNAPRLVMSDAPSTSSNVERVALMRQRSASVLKEPGYVRL
jgi:hypothetical protein